ncbi:pilus assembly protein TadG-related protein [Amaricoccus tamworthensis]|uniref:TadE/TadG family type IV pilus assembly protein n=1 Tax=Amaricoccus tamworthensis TaxID=57002 RepID=UPI003C798F66
MWRSPLALLKKRFPRSLIRDERGAIAIMFALMLVPTFGAVGLAVDLTNGYILKSRLSKSIDSAALAAGRAMANGNAETVARQFFEANFGQSIDSLDLTSFEFKVSDDEKLITMEVSAKKDTFFMRVFNRDTMNVSARTVVEREATGLELAMVLDVTGSMASGKKFKTMQSSALSLIDTLFGDDEELENVWVSIVPFVASLNIGTHNSDWLNPLDRAIVSVEDYLTEGWRGCVEARPSPYDEDDAPPSVQDFTSYFYPSTRDTQEEPSSDKDNPWPPIRSEWTYGSTGYGPNHACGPEIIPLTKSRTTLETGLKNLVAWHRGGTTANLGLSWGWRTLSPRWRGVWKGDERKDLPLDYDTPGMVKSVIILTDGENNLHDQDSKGNTRVSDYTAYGRLNEGRLWDAGAYNRSQGRALLDKKLAATCEAMKDEGINIYTITYGSGASSGTIKNLFRNCASVPAMYYHAPANQDLAGIFDQIAGELASLRIVE